MKTAILCLFLLWQPIQASSEETQFDKNVENTTFLNPACPAMLTGVYADSPTRRKGRVSVHLVNESEKRVIAVKVGLDGLDAARDSHPFVETYASTLSLKPEKEAKPIWYVEDENFAVNIASGVRVYILKLIFADGSTWKDDGTRSCSLSISGRAKPQPSDE